MKADQATKITKPAPTDLFARQNVEPEKKARQLVEIGRMKADQATKITKPAPTDLFARQKVEPEKRRVG
jgi:hypothetical protein